MKLRSRWGTVCGGVYLALVILAGAYAAYQLIFNTANSELCGVPLIMVTLPWSLMLFQLERLVGLPANPLLVIFNVVCSVLINAAAFYCAGAMMQPAERS